MDASLATAPDLRFSVMTDAEVLETLHARGIGLTVEEARRVEEMLGRPPTLVEAVIWSIQGSEHCSYKSSRRFLKMLPVSGRHVILGPGEDSGIVAITDGPPGKRWGLAVSHESHNKPSQIVPFEGAATGFGGVVRDVACMGARVIGCMDMLRLGDLKTEESRGIAREVARGIAGYGNPLGVPNLGGDTAFDRSYNAQCLVNVLAVGIVREDEIIRSTVPDEAGEAGYDIIIVGKPTDRSGFGGAAFASRTLREEQKEQNTGAVQEPNPFLERHLLASTYALFDWLTSKDCLSKVSFKDLGAGGVVCSTVEQVAEKGYGVDIDLGNVHVSVPDLTAEVIACAETQERFCWICHPNLTQRILRHYNEEWALPRIAEGAGASVIGKVTRDPHFRLRHRGAIVCDARSEDITHGLQYVRETASSDTPRAEPAIACDGDVISLSLGDRIVTTTISDAFKAILSHPNHASIVPFLCHYDKTVIGNGLLEAGEADASVIIPLQDLQSYVLSGTHPGWELPAEDRFVGLALASDGNGRYGRISAYWQGANAVSKAICNVAAVGALPRALTDCLNYGNPEVPSQLGALEGGVRGIADAAQGFVIGGETVPVISGNVSLYNGKPDGSAIPPTAIVCCIGVLKDARVALTRHLKASDSRLLLLGTLKDECGGSAYYHVLEEMAGGKEDALLGSNLPHPEYALLSRCITFLANALGERLLRSCHDLSTGGLLTTLFEMTLPHRKSGGTIGIDADLAPFEGMLRTDAFLFTETNAFILEADPSLLPALERLAQEHAVPLLPLGRTLEEPVFTVRNGPMAIVSEELGALRMLWENGLARALRLPTLPK